MTAFAQDVDVTPFRADGSVNRHGGFHSLRESSQRPSIIRTQTITP